MTAWTNVSVSVLDMDVALALWADSLGLEIRSQKHGEDPDLARLWGLSGDDINRQALLGNPGMETGLLHLVEFNQPGEAVRQGAQKFDLCPKNLDVYVHDLPARFEELKSAGYKFHNQNYSELTAPDGTAFREIHMHGHDELNIVLLEVIDLKLLFTQQGYAGIGPLVTTVADAGIERKFYQEIIGMSLLNDNRLEGPEIEKMIGLPPGSALDVSIWGGEGESFGQVEIVDYIGVEGNDLYPRANPKQRGILQVTYQTTDLQDLIKRLDRAGISWTEGGQLSILQGTGRFIRIHSPAGLRIDVFEPS
jgi:catechol 2,3-dioxygenase-like lactoylglutathione lyase family enzyme